ncbi:protein PrkA [Bacillus methanolicus]|uniref:Protein PrkA n=1 Tax=Bacillus methanolicus (strain MGA3 / ATCC 53907) TaxID=796606 RepID=I3E8Z6_BACMM|nr:protein PrkA [Bacillus methanolicus]AIE60229.1 Protein PrkA [Bacillus methanolicus MGA3]EIJ82967.1 serine protein kinase [Bacillus methanolicus MGA3]
MSFINKVKKYQENNDELKWTGTFAEYLELVKERPYIAQNAHSRIYNMIMSSGILENSRGQKIYKFFNDEIYGLEHVFERLVEDYFKPAAFGLDVKKRLLLLMGPVSGGKSSIVTLLKKGLEAYTRTEEGAVYAIKGCPMNQEPLLLLPHHLRKEFEQEMNIKIEGELNPYTLAMVKEKYNGKILDVEVERIFFSEKERVGIGTFSPSDPKSQDISELIGSIDFSTVTTYGSESDPRAYRFDGELNISNRGLMEFQEILKCDEKFLWHLLSLTQEGNFKAGRFSLIHADELIIAHTNETEYRSFVENKKNEALISRMIVVKVPYNLSINEEQRIYLKAIKHPNLNVEFSPNALEAVSSFSISTRLEHKNETIPTDVRLQVYNHEENKKTTFKDIQRQYPRDGMFGIDPRYIINRISSSIICQNGIVDEFHLLESILDGLYELPGLKKDEKEFYEKLAQNTIKKYEEKLKETFTNLIFSYNEDFAQSFAANYFKELVKFIENGEGDEKILKEIEDIIGISNVERREFREEIYRKTENMKKQGNNDMAYYKLLSPIKSGVEKLVLEQTMKFLSTDSNKLYDIAEKYSKEKNCSLDMAMNLLNRFCAMTGMS